MAVKAPTGHHKALFWRCPYVGSQRSLACPQCLQAYGQTGYGGYAQYGYGQQGSQGLNFGQK